LKRFFTTALTLSAAEIVRKYGHRWALEIAIRSQVDVAWACRAALQETGIFPIPRFTPELAENDEDSKHALPLAA